MRAVIEPNILVRVVIKPQGTVGPILLRLRRGDYSLLYSQPLLEELIDMLNRPRLRQMTISKPSSVSSCCEGKPSHPLSPSP